MIEIPTDTSPSKEFSTNTDIGTLRFRTYWNSFMPMWYLDIVGQDGNDLLSGIALTTGTNNLIKGTNVQELDGCAIFVVDTGDKGNTTYGGLGTSVRVFMTFPGEEAILPY